MELLTIILIAIGLSMDSIAVSIAVSPCFIRKKTGREDIKFAGVLAISHVSFIIIGWFFGTFIEKYFQNYTNIIAFLILLGIGIKMIYEGLKTNKEIKNFNATNFFVLLGLGVATSIDALFVAVSMALAEFNLLATIIIISIVTFLLSLLSIKFGKSIKSKLKFSVELCGGIILILIGVKILLENSLF